jgi:hypothetical protein
LCLHGLPETQEDEDALMNLLEMDRNQQKRVILDNVLEESLMGGRASSFPSYLRGTDT